MTRQRQDYLNEMKDWFVRLELSIQADKALRHQDSHIELESFFCELLNTAFDWELGNVNALFGKNHDSFDLSDPVNGIAVQVTTSTTSRKIRKTLETFVGKHDGTYRRLVFCYPVIRLPAGRSAISHLLKGFDFDRRRDSVCLGTILGKAQDASVDKQAEIVRLLRKELGPIGATVHTQPSEKDQIAVAQRGDRRVLGRLRGVPSLPYAYIERTNPIESIRKLLLPETNSVGDSRSGAAPIGIYGMGGIGKSVLAAGLAHDLKVREGFPDGIVWIGLGSSPDVCAIQRRVHRDLGGDGAIETEHEGKTRLKELLADKAVLLIVDDVWRRADFGYFDVLGSRCRAFVTTRDLGLLTSLGGVHHLVELLTDDEAQDLLAMSCGIPRELPVDAKRLIAECGRLPLALALCGGMFRRGMAWSEILQQLEQARIDRIADRHAVEPHHQSIWHAIHASVEFLGPAERERFLELAVYPPDEETPAAAIETLWAHTGRLDEWEAQELLLTLRERSLIRLTMRESDSEQSSHWNVSLHDLVFDYAEHANKDAMPLHDQILAAYHAICADDWSSGPDDGYYFSHLRHHLRAAGRIQELADLLHDLRWLEAKNEAGLTFDLLADFEATLAGVERTNTCQEVLRLLAEAMQRDIHFIARHSSDYPQGLFQCMWNRCWWHDCDEAGRHFEVADTDKSHLPWEQEGERLSRLMETWRSEKEKRSPGFTWLRTLRPPALQLGVGMVSVMRGHQSSPGSIAYSPDGRRLISGSSDKTARIWDTSNGSELYCLDHPDSVQSVTYSPDGQRIATSSNNVTHIWDASDGRLIFTLQNTCKPAYSPDGQRLVTRLSNGFCVWSGLDGVEILRVDGLEDRVETVAFTPDGQRIITGAGDRWDFSRNGPRKVTGEAGKIVQLWDARSGIHLDSLQTHQSQVNRVLCAPDGRHAVTLSSDNKVRVYDVLTGVQLHCIDHYVRSVAFSPDGQRLACGHRYSVSIWDIASRSQIQCIDGYDEGVDCAAYSPDGKNLAVGAGPWENTVTVRDLTSSTKLDYYLRDHREQVVFVNSSRDGKRLVSGSFDQTVRIWEVESGVQLMCLRGHKGAGLGHGVVMAAAFSPRGDVVASGSNDLTVRVWNAISGEELAVLQGHEGIINCVAFSPDGNRIISGADDHTVRVWDARSGALIHCLTGLDSTVDRVAYSTDGRWIRGSNEGRWNRNSQAMQIWDAETGCLLENEPTGHEASFTSNERMVPFMAVAESLETSIQRNDSGATVAWFPDQLGEHISLPGSYTWAGVAGCHLYMIELEGVVN